MIEGGILLKTRWRERAVWSEVTSMLQQVKTLPLQASHAMPCHAMLTREEQEEQEER